MFNLFLLYQLPLESLESNMDYLNLHGVSDAHLGAATSPSHWRICTH